MYLREMRQNGEQAPQVPPKTPLASEMYDIPKNLRVRRPVIASGRCVQVVIVSPIFYSA